MSVISGGNSKIRHPLILVVLTFAGTLTALALILIFNVLAIVLATSDGIDSEVFAGLHRFVREDVVTGLAYAAPVVLLHSVLLVFMALSFGIARHFARLSWPAAGLGLILSLGSIFVVESFVSEVTFADPLARGALVASAVMAAIAGAWCLTRTMILFQKRASYG